MVNAADEQNKSAETLSAYKNVSIKTLTAKSEKNKRLPYKLVYSLIGIKNETTIPTTRHKGIFHM